MTKGAADVPPGRLFLALTSPVAVTLLIAFGLLGAYAVTSLDPYCAKTCHSGTPAARSATKAAHAPCVSCHEASRWSVFANSSSRLRMVWNYSSGADPKDATTGMQSQSCSRCHRQVQRETTVSSEGVRMSHKEVLAAGRPCSQCHADAGHRSAALGVSMSSCLPCHDSETASSECDYCHVAEALARDFFDSQPEKALGSGRWDYPPVRAAKRECGACHDEANECDTCHGIRMPHSQAFKEGRHAPTAAFERKTRCWKCHDPQFCSNSDCHKAAFEPRDGSTTHGDNWKQEHKRSSWESGCVCHQARNARTKPICTLCHAENHAVLQTVQ